MNPAARRARQKKLQADLARAFNDEEAVPPEWVDLASDVRESAAALRSEVELETERFVSEPDIAKAIARRERFSTKANMRIEELNAKIRRLNLIAPHARFTRRALDGEAMLRTLYRSERWPG